MGIRAEMSMNKTLHVLNRTLDTVFQKQPGNFLGSGLNADKVGLVESLMAGYQREIAALKPIMKVFDGIMHSCMDDAAWPAMLAGGDESQRSVHRSILVGRYRNICQNFGILVHNYTSAVENRWKFKPTYGNSYGIAQEPSVRIVEITYQWKIIADFQVLQQSMIELKHLLVETKPFGSLPFGDVSDCMRHLNALDSHLNALCNVFLEICHNGKDESAPWAYEEVPDGGRD